MKKLRKTIHCKSLEISQENVCYVVYFSKVTSLQCADRNSTRKKLYHNLFLEYVPKTSCFKKSISRNTSMVDRPFNKVLDLWYTPRSFIKKRGSC